MEKVIQDVDFSPAWWLPGAHAQTIWRRLFGGASSVPVDRERWETVDGDFLDIDFLNPPASDSSPKDAPIVLFLHGLEGSSRAKYILGMLREVSSVGWSGAALNFRSCSGEINRRERFYHSGETTDLDWVVRRLIDRRPKSPLFLVGFSLGGNVLLKWLGEQGENAPAAVRAAVAISTPFDLATAARLIDRGFSRLYGKMFLKTLKRKAILKGEQYPGLIDPSQVRQIESFAQFDDQVTAPIHGFKNGFDYWTRSSSQYYLSDIRRPTLLINAKDDPFLPGIYFPEKAIAESKWLSTSFPSRGGHTGFVQSSGFGSASYWAEVRTIFFLRAFI